MPQNVFCEPQVEELDWLGPSLASEFEFAMNNDLSDPFHQLDLPQSWSRPDNPWFAKI
jgi:hypothetical protein